MSNNGNGFRQEPKAGRKERLRNMDASVQNLEMASRINQMMTQQLMQNIKGMHEDLGRALGLINELQYKILAVQKVSGLDLSALGEVADELRLNDFCEASDKEDAANGFTVVDTVAENSTVILTSTTEGSDKGIFRSRIKLAECGVPDLINAFMGRQVGAKALIKLNGVDHEVELLGIRQPSVSAAAAGGDESGADESVQTDLSSSSSDQAEGSASGQVVGNA